MGDRIAALAGGSIVGLVLVWIALIPAILIGWVVNIIKLVSTVPHETTMVVFVLRAVGVVLAPLGAVMGYFV